MAEGKGLLLASASLIGVLLISLWAEDIEIGLMELEDINAFMLNEIVHIRGVVKEYGPIDGGVRLLVEQNGYDMSVVYFGDIDGRKGMCADVIGEVKTSRGPVEITAERLTLFIC